MNTQKVLTIIDIRSTVVQSMEHIIRLIPFSQNESKNAPPRRYSAAKRGKQHNIGRSSYRMTKQKN